MDDPSCPECKANKHNNCDGGAWDDLFDKLVPCACNAAGHSFTFVHKD